MWCVRCRCVESIAYCMHFNFYRVYTYFTYFPVVQISRFILHSCWPLYCTYPFMSKLSQTNRLQMAVDPQNTNIVNHTKRCALYDQPPESTSTKRIYVAILYTNEASRHLKLFQMKLRIVKSAFVPSLHSLNPINAHTVCTYDNDKYLTTCIQ